LLTPLIKVIRVKELKGCTLTSHQREGRLSNYASIFQSVGRGKTFMSSYLNGNGPHFISQSKASKYSNTILYQPKIGKHLVKILASSHGKMRLTRCEPRNFSKSPHFWKKSPRLDSNPYNPLLEGKSRTYTVLP
jgi:hypothetical protein